MLVGTGRPVGDATGVGVAVVVGDDGDAARVVELVAEVVVAGGDDARELLGAAATGLASARAVPPFSASRSWATSSTEPRRARGDRRM